jgi:hypothetical protein
MIYTWHRLLGLSPGINNHKATVSADTPQFLTHLARTSSRYVPVDVAWLGYATPVCGNMSLSSKLVVVIGTPFLPGIDSWLDWSSSTLSALSPSITGNRVPASSGIDSWDRVVPYRQWINTCNWVIDTYSHHLDFLLSIVDLPIGSENYKNTLTPGIKCHHWVDIISIK